MFSSSSSSRVSGLKRRGDDDDDNDEHSSEKKTCVGLSSEKKTHVELWAACLPLQILSHMASFLDYSGAVNVASACRSLKKLIDRDYVVTKQAKIYRVFSAKTKQRLPGVVGKFVNLVIENEDHELLDEPNFLKDIWKHAKTITVNCLNKSPLLDLKLMEGLCKLSFESTWNTSIDLLKLPQSLRCLSLEGFNEPVNASSLPPGLVHLDLGLHFNRPVDQIVLPHGLEILEFGFSFDQPVDRLVLPAGLKSLTFSTNFNQPVDELVLPHGLEELKFGKGFNQPVDRLILPSSLKSLMFDWHFDHPINDLKLPESLEVLDLGYCFTQSLQMVRWPPNMKLVRLPANYVRSVHVPRGVQVSYNLGSHQKNKKNQHRLVCALLDKIKCTISS
jgi:hypothetical protein